MNKHAGSLVYTLVFNTVFTPTHTVTQTYTNMDVTIDTVTVHMHMESSLPVNAPVYTYCE